MPEPQNPAPVSGPGKFSRRTDGQEKAVDTLDNPDMQYGDRAMLEAGQGVAPLKGVEGGATSSSGQTRRPTGAPPTRGGIPDFLLNSPDNAPGEPTTAGVDMGAGPGHEALDASQPSPDIREQVLEFMLTQYGNEDVAAMLDGLRQERAARPDPMATMPTVGMGTGLPSSEETPAEIMTAPEPVEGA